jgi:multidrug transporter EmrE-like cation transporter
MWLGIGAVAVASMLVLVIRSPLQWEKLAGIVVIVLGAAPSLINLAAVMIGGVATC